MLNRDFKEFIDLEDVLYQSNISGFETGEREPPLPIILQYARAAGVCVDVLIDDEMDLPENLPGIPQHKGIKQKTAPRTKRKRK
ncbi:MAG: hypothetical protein L0229_18825 [Blastocatellia bacterium]|nr:hypothetical protein [Blastocatellia bacterium]